MAIDEKKLIEVVKDLPMVNSAFLISLIEAQPKLDVPDTNVGMMWIPVKYDEEEGWFYNLPDDGQEVLVCRKNGYVRLDTFVDNGEDGCYWDSGNDINEYQAWMPLPEPYKGDE